MPEGVVPAGVLFDGVTATGVAVSGVVDGGVLRLTSVTGEGVTGEWVAGEAVAAWRLAEMVRCDRDAPAGSAVFRQGGAPRLSVTDAGLLAALRAGGVDLGHASDWGVRQWAGFAAALVGSLAVGAVLIDRLPGLVAPLVPAAVERGWSGTIEAALEAGGRRCNGAAGTAALDGLVARLGAAAGLARAPRLRVLDIAMVNAFTLPDGRIVLMRGLIEAASGPDELSGVLAHEIGHVRRADPTREMVRGLALNMVARSLGWGSSLAGQMAALSYGRRAEAAADASAVVTLRRAGMRADGLRSFFVTLQGRAGEGGLGFLSDHPSTASRIAMLPDEASGAAALGDGAWAAVRGVCE